MTVGEFINTLAKKAGLQMDSEEMKSLLTNEWMAKVEMPEQIEKGIQNKLISVEDAKNNHPDIKPFYTAQAMSTVDGWVREELLNRNVDDDIKAEISAEKSSFKKLPLLLKKIEELNQKKNATADRTDKAAYQKQIDDLHSKVRAADDREKQLQADFAQKEKDIKVQYKLDSMFSNHKTIYDTLEPDVRYETFRTLLRKDLQDNALRMDFDDDGSFVLLKKDGTNHYGANNQQVNPEQFVQQLLANKKLLVTTQPVVNGTQGNTPSATPNQPTVGNGSLGKEQPSPLLKSILQQSMKDFKESSDIPIQ